MLQLYPRSGAVHLLNAIDRPLLLVEGNAGPWTQTPFKKNVCFSHFLGNVAGQAEGAGGTLPVPGDCYPSDPAGADRVVPHVPALHRGAAAPALPVAAVVLRPAGLPSEKKIVFIIFFGTLQRLDLLLLGQRDSSHQGLATFLQLPLLDLQRSEKNNMLLLVEGNAGPWTQTPF